MQSTPHKGESLFCRYSCHFKDFDKFLKLYGIENLFVELKVTDIDEDKQIATVFYPSLLTSETKPFAYFKKRNILK